MWDVARGCPLLLSVTLLVSRCLCCTLLITHCDTLKALWPLPFENVLFEASLLIHSLVSSWCQNVNSMMRTIVSTPAMQSYECAYRLDLFLKIYAYTHLFLSFMYNKPLFHACLPSDGNPCYLVHADIYYAGQLWVRQWQHSFWHWHSPQTWSSVLNIEWIQLGICGTLSLETQIVDETYRWWSEEKKRPLTALIEDIGGWPCATDLQQYLNIHMAQQRTFCSTNECLWGSKTVTFFLVSFCPVSFHSAWLVTSQSSQRHTLISRLNFPQSQSSMSN